MQSQMQLRDVAAKFPNEKGQGTWQSIITHLYITGTVAQVVFDRVVAPGIKEMLSRILGLPRPEVRRLVGYIASVHDIGKIEYCFQAKDPLMEASLAQYYSDMVETVFGSIRHEMTSAAYLQEVWMRENEIPRIADMFANVVGAHHQGKEGSGHVTSNKEWNRLRKECDMLMRKVFLHRESVDFPLIVKEDEGIIAVLLLGIVILSDWISSSKRFEDADKYVLRACGDVSDLQDRVKSRITAKAVSFIKDAGLDTEVVEWPETFCGMWKNFQKSKRRQVQADVEEIMRTSGKRPALMLIEAPPGEGKTEAGLYVAARMAQAWNKRGMFMAMPTGATANQNIKRMENMCDMKGVSASVHLIHSAASFQQEEVDTSGKDEVAKFLMSTRREMSAMFGTGTVDQAMMSVLRSNYSVVRLLGLANKALIIDEIHAYDAYMDKIIVRLLQWCKALEIPVVMMSATLPPRLKEKLMWPYTRQNLSCRYPLITTVYEDGTVVEKVVSKTSHKLKVRFTVEAIASDYEEIAKRAVEKVKDGGCICVLMNTVNTARKVYSAIAAIYDGDLGLFHSRVEQGCRTYTERECVKRYGKDKSHRPKQSILVATQVVEQSMDLDFDYMFLAIAPIDLIVQRIGRLHRHDDTVRPPAFAEPQVTIMTPIGWTSALCPFAGVVYPVAILESTAKVLEGRTTIRVPEDIPELVAKGYDDTLFPEFQKDWEKFRKLEAAREIKAGRFLISKPWESYSQLLAGSTVIKDKNDVELYATTRDADPSIKIALLPSELYQRVIDACFKSEELAKKIKNPEIVNGKRVAPEAILGDFALAKEVESHVATIRYPETLAHTVFGEDFDSFGLDGKWLISGIKLFEMNGTCALRLPRGVVIRSVPVYGVMGSYIAKGGQRGTI